MARADSDARKKRVCHLHDSEQSPGGKGAGERVSSHSRDYGKETGDPRRDDRTLSGAGADCVLAVCSAVAL